MTLRVYAFSVLFAVKSVGKSRRSGTAKNARSTKNRERSMAVRVFAFSVLFAVKSVAMYASMAAFLGLGRVLVCRNRSGR